MRRLEPCLSLHQIRRLRTQCWLVADFHAISSMRSPVPLAASRHVPPPAPLQLYVETDWQASKGDAIIAVFLLGLRLESRRFFCGRPSGSRTHGVDSNLSLGLWTCSELEQRLMEFRLMDFHVDSGGIACVAAILVGFDCLSLQSGSPSLLYHVIEEPNLLVCHNSDRSLMDRCFFHLQIAKAIRCFTQ